MLITYQGTRLLFIPPHAEHHGEHKHFEHEEHSEITLAILEEFGVELESVSCGILEEAIHLPGEIQIDPDRLAHITPRFDGVVKEVFKHIGERVKKNELFSKLTFRK